MDFSEINYDNNILNLIMNKMKIVIVINLFLNMRFISFLYLNKKKEILIISQRSFAPLRLSGHFKYVTENSNNTYVVFVSM